MPWRGDQGISGTHPCVLDTPLRPLFRHDRKVSKQNFATLSPDENSKIEKLTN